MSNIFEVFSQGRAVARRLLGNFNFVRCKIRKIKFGRQTEKKLRGRKFFLEVRDLIRKINDMHLESSMEAPSYLSSSTKPSVQQGATRLLFRSDPSLFHC
jgi:hypothetical protein